MFEEMANQAVRKLWILKLRTDQALETLKSGVRLQGEENKQLSILTAINILEGGRD